MGAKWLSSVPFFSDKLQYGAFVVNEVASTGISASRLIQVYHQDERKLETQNSQWQRRRKA